MVGALVMLDYHQVLVLFSLVAVLVSIAFVLRDNGFSLSDILYL